MGLNKEANDLDTILIEQCPRDQIRHLWWWKSIFWCHMHIHSATKCRWKDKRGR